MAGVHTGRDLVLLHRGALPLRRGPLKDPIHKVVNCLQMQACLSAPAPSSLWPSGPAYQLIGCNTLVRGFKSVLHKQGCQVAKLTRLQLLAAAASV